MTSTERFVRNLIGEFPELEPILSAHLDDNFGEVLPHVLLADVKRHLVSMYASHDRALEARVRSILSYLDTEFGAADSEVRNLVGVSFIELLPRNGEAGAEIRTLLGPKLRAEAERSD